MLGICRNDASLLQQELRTRASQSQGTRLFRNGSPYAGSCQLEAMMGASFRDLLVWQKAMDLADAVYTATADFPRHELFGLTSQMRRAAVSIPSNIAEGRAVGGGRYHHHLRIAIGSEAELQTQIELAVRRAYISPDSARRLLNDASEVGRMLHGVLNGIARHRAAGLTALIVLMYSASVLTP